MKAYFSIAQKRRKAFVQEVDTITNVLGSLGIGTFVFVDKYGFGLSQEKEMMRQAMTDIDACDLLIAEVSEKAIGVGAEAGYAKGKGKTVIYLRRSDAEHSTTVSGISDYHVVYDDLEDLRINLEKIIKLWMSQQA